MERRKAFEKSIEGIKVPRPLAFLPVEQCSPTTLHQAFLDCELADEFAKKELIERAAVCISHDGVIDVAEAEFMRAFGAVLDCPMPVSG